MRPSWSNSTTASTAASSTAWNSRSRRCARSSCSSATRSRVMRQDSNRSFSGLILPARMANSTVLLIDANTDDERLFREELALVRDQPFALEVVRSLGAALALLKEQTFDVILLDLNLPDSLGLTTFLRLQPKAGLQPIVVLVGQGDEDVGTEAVERGALDYLIKQQVVSTLLAKALQYATERTHTMLALKASESRYRGLYENVVAGVFQTTPDGKFMAANS